VPKDEAIPELLPVAETNSDPAVRKDAIFWLGQTHDPRALAYSEQISGALEDTQQGYPRHRGRIQTQGRGQ
jgi:HEAT repeat protein